jgi:hypothetical protein
LSKNTLALVKNIAMQNPAATISQKGGNLVLTIPRQLVGDEFVKRIMEHLEFLNLVQQNRMTASEALQISEAIKSDWWKANREQILQKIQQG